MYPGGTGTIVSTLYRPRTSHRLATLYLVYMGSLYNTHTLQSLNCYRPRNIHTIFIENLEEVLYCRMIRRCLKVDRFSFVQLVKD